MAPLLFDKPALFRGVTPPMGVRRRLTARRSLTPPRLDSTPLRRTLLAWVFRNGWQLAPTIALRVYLQYNRTMCTPKLAVRLMFLALPLWALAAYGEAPGAGITVKVKSQGGSPIQSAKVSVSFAEKPEATVTNQGGRPTLKLGLQVQTIYFVSKPVQTNQDGEVKMPMSLPQREVLFTVGAPGFQTLKQTIEIKEDQPTVEFTLNPQQREER